MRKPIDAFLLAAGLAIPMGAVAQTRETQTPTVPAPQGQGMVRAPVAANPSGHSGVIVPPQTDKSINIPATRGATPGETPMMKSHRHRHSVKVQKND